jgi:hypothetical protein
MQDIQVTAVEALVKRILRIGLQEES